MLKIKQDKLITAGEFAYIAESTKRTIHWYTKQGLLKPKKVNSRGYRFYSIEQIIDFQVISLLRKLNFSLPEIKKFLRKNTSPKELFLQKKKDLLKEVSNLQKKIKDISEFYTNMETEGVFVKPNIKIIPTFKAYIIEKVGAYSQIYNYCFELKSYFSKVPKNATYFVAFPDREYSPRKDRLKIGVVATSNMKLKKEAKDIVQKETISSFKSLNYRLIGSPSLISMIIMQMHEYMRKRYIKQNLKIPINELEFYIRSALNGHQDDNTCISEINIPIL